MKSTRLATLALATTLAISACSDNIGPAGSDQISEDVAIMAADAALQDLQQMVGSFASAPEPDFLASTMHGESSARTVTFFDVDGNEQPAMDPETTASIHIVADVNRTVTRDDWNATVERHRDMTITGLLGQETSRTSNGTGSSTITGSKHSDEFGDRTYEMSGEMTIGMVVMGVPRSENPWPLSGTITRSMTVTVTNGPDGDVTREFTAVITFNGTQFVTMTVNGESFEVDLAERNRNRPRRHR